MKKTGIKFYVIRQLIISCIWAFGLTYLSFILIFGSLHIISEEKYIYFLNLCNHNMWLMGAILIGTGFLFVVYFLLIFIRCIGHLTEYIDEIITYVNQIAKGDLKVNIPIKQYNELGTLAEQINKMTKALDEARKKEDEWNRQKYHLLTNLSHDLKTPLMSVMGFLERICNKQYNDEEMLIHYSQTAFNKSVQLKESIEKLFELSRLNDSDIKINKTSINIEELVQQVLMGFIPELDKKHINYRIQVNTKQVTMEGDAMLLVRVFENLISNAIKYGIGAKNLDMIIKTEKDKLVIHVVNDGEPINAEEIKKIFERFYRSEKNMDRREGNGVGLAIVKTIITLHHGTIEVISDKEKTDFKIKLPFK